MTKMSLKQINEATLKNSTNFINRTESKILYNADVAADILDFEWHPFICIEKIYWSC